MVLRNLIVYQIVNLVGEEDAEDDGVDYEIEMGDEEEGGRKNLKKVKEQEESKKKLEEEEEELEENIGNVNGQCWCSRC
jgi:hypothetical protein